MNNWKILFKKVINARVRHANSYQALTFDHRSEFSQCLLLQFICFSQLICCSRQGLFVFDLLELESNNVSLPQVDARNFLVNIFNRHFIIFPPALLLLLYVNPIAIAAWSQLNKIKNHSKLFKIFSWALGVVVCVSRWNTQGRAFVELKTKV